MQVKIYVATALVCISSVLFTACGGNDGTTADGTTAEGGEVDVTALANSGDEVHGNEVKPGDVELTTPLNAQWVADGKGIYEMKCQSCHRLTDERLVGPGWQGVTKEREPHWIMNMITNVDMMLEKDPEAQKLLEQCLVRMPNQNVTKEDARKLLEYMRSNDGEK